jgi:hypothetical protein
LPLDFRGSSCPEAAGLLSDSDGLGIDGVFVDCPATAAMCLAYLRGSQDEACERREDAASGGFAPWGALALFVVLLLVLCACAFWVTVVARRSRADVYKPVTLQSDSSLQGAQWPHVTVATELAERRVS